MTSHTTSAEISDYVEYGDDDVSGSEVWRFDITGLTRREVVLLHTAMGLGNGIAAHSELQPLYDRILDALYPTDAVVTFPESEATR